MQNMTIPLTRVNKAKVRRTIKKARAILILIGLILLVSQVFISIGNFISNHIAVTQSQEEVSVPVAQSPEEVSVSYKEELSVPDKYEEIVITIMKGDRAWNIQSRLTPNEDVRDVLYYVELINGKSVSNIQPGEEIVFLGLANN